MGIQLKPEHKCPLNGFEPCRQLECAWFTQIRGTDPQSGKDIDEWGCAVSWLPLLLIENASRSIQTGAAIESFRNEVAKTQMMITPPAGVGEHHAIDHRPR